LAFAFSALTLLVGRQEGHPAVLFCKRIFFGTVIRWQSMQKPSCPHLAFWLITKLKCAIFNEKNNDTKDYSNNWNFCTVNLIMLAKKIVNQSSDFPVRRTGSYRHKKALASGL